MQACARRHLQREITVIKVAVVGTGYVGLSLAILLAQHNEVVALDIAPERINMLNNGQSPITDGEIDLFLKTKALNLLATLDKFLAYQNADFVIIATPTYYDADTTTLIPTQLKRSFKTL